VWWRWWWVGKCSTGLQPTPYLPQVEELSVVHLLLSLQLLYLCLKLVYICFSLSQQLV
jgi:hypothetical protein